MREEKLLIKNPTINFTYRKGSCKNKNPFFKPTVHAVKLFSCVHFIIFCHPYASGQAMEFIKKIFIAVGINCSKIFMIYFYFSFSKEDQNLLKR
jgi:hypothetical protein